MKLSLILPAYNAERTIEATLQSIFAQERREDWEVLVVDDSSDDATPQILARLAEKESALRWISIPNSGPAGARTAGMERANGDYFLFCDSDDLFLPGAFLKIEEQLARDPAELLVFGFAIADSAEGELKPYHYQTPFAGDRAEWSRHLPALYRANQLNQVWGKAFSAKLIRENGLRFPDLKFGEDRLFLFEVIGKAQRFAAIPDPLYLYLQQPGSLVSRFLPEKAEICAAIDARVRALFAQFGARSADSEKMLDYMFVKSILSVLITLYAPSCPLSYREKRRFIKTMFALPALRQRRAFPADCGKSFRILAWVLKTRSVTLNLAAAFALHSGAKLAPGLFRKAKHAYNKEKGEEK